MTRTAVGEYDKCMLSFLNNCHHYSFLFQWKTFRVASCILLPWPICFVSSSYDFLSDSRRHPRLLLDISSPNFTLCIVHFSLSLTKFWVESNGEAADLPFSFPLPARSDEHTEDEPPATKPNPTNSGDHLQVEEPFSIASHTWWLRSTYSKQIWNLWKIVWKQ